MLGLVALLIVASFMNLLLQTFEARSVAISNVIIAVILASILIVPKRYRLGAHVVVFLVYSLLQIATDTIVEAPGHILFLFTILIWKQYGIPQAHRRLIIVALSVLWLAAVIASGSGYLHQPMTPLSASQYVRRLRAISYFFLYICIAWQFWVIVGRPARNAREAYERRIARLNEIAERYGRLTGKRFVVADGADPLGATTPVQADALATAIALLEDAEASGEMMREEILFVRRLLGDLLEDSALAVDRMNATTARATAVLRERSSELRSRSG